MQSKKIKSIKKWMSKHNEHWQIRLLSRILIWLQENNDSTLSPEWIDEIDYDFAGLLSDETDWKEDYYFDQSVSVTFRHNTNKIYLNLFTFGISVSDSLNNEYLMDRLTDYMSVDHPHEFFEDEQASFIGIQDFANEHFLNANQIKRIVNSIERGFENFENVDEAKFKTVLFLVPCEETEEE